MLDDRPYMRRDFRLNSSREMRVSVLLIGINVAVYLLMMMAAGPGLRGLDRIYALFALSPEGLLHGYVWQLVTYQFMHGSIFHLLFNCMGLYFVGRVMENVLERRAFLTVYFAGGILGGILQVLFGLIPAIGSAPTVGASAGLMALLGAFCIQFYRQPFQLAFPPVTLTGKSMLLIVAAIDVLGMFSSQSNVAHIAHLGGLATGALFMKQGWQHRIPTIKMEGWFKPGGGAKKARPVSRFQPEPGRPPVERTDFMSSEVDPILEKISAHGIHSLTAREREILEQAQKRMSGRR